MAMFLWQLGNRPLLPVRAPALAKALEHGELLALALPTTLIGFIDLGPFSMGIAILIATAKACLIVAFFMHAFYESKLIRIIIGAGVIWFLIIVTHHQ